MKRALFLDRDGIFNALVERDGGLHSPRNWEEVRHYKGLKALSAIKARGFLLVLITNQPDIERGIVSETFCRELHDFYRETYALDAVYVCPHAAPDHPWKKPNPGMFFQAKLDLAMDLEASFHLGDTSSDVIAATRAGVTPILWTRDYNLEVGVANRVSTLEKVSTLLSANGASRRASGE